MAKKILIDINHPGHVHLFKNFIFEMRSRGHEIFTCVKDVRAVIELMEQFSLDYINLGSKSDFIPGKLLDQVKYLRKIYRLVKRYDIRFGIGSSISIPYVSKLTKLTSFDFDDDDSIMEPLVSKFSLPFSDYLISPDALAFERTKSNHINYNGYHELAYLHPKRFEPDPGIFKLLGIPEGETYFVLRFNAFKAHHDVGVRGIEFSKKLELIDLLKDRGRVYITTERDIDPEFEQYGLTLPTEKIHSLLYYAKMLIGDSQTMTSEAAVLGTPAVKCNSFAGKLSIPNEIENKYQLCFAFKPDEESLMFEKIRDLLDTEDLDSIWQERRRNLLQDKIDVTAFFVWLIEEFPESVENLKTDPEYLQRFR